MRAMVITRFGGTDVFERRELPDPTPGPGEVRVRVYASGTNPVDAKIRAHGQWAKIEPPAVLGYDASGVVDAVGPGVTDFRPGDEVFYTPEIHGNQRGTYAELNVVSAAIVAKKPKKLTHAEAAAVPLAAGTAYEAIVRRLAVALGETVLVHGGAGGVGSFAIQLAKLSGARVLSTSSPAHHGLLRQLGADVAIDYRKEDFVEICRRETNGQGVDAVFDTVGGENLARSLPALRAHGRIASILAPSGDLSAMQHQNLTLHGIFLTRERARLEELSRLIDRGQLRPVVAEVLPLEEVARAHERLDSGHGAGKIVLEIRKD